MDKNTSKYPQIKAEELYNSYAQELIGTHDPKGKLGLEILPWQNADEDIQKYFTFIATQMSEKLESFVKMGRLVNRLLPDKKIVVRIGENSSLINYTIDNSVAEIFVFYKVTRKPTKKELEKFPNIQHTLKEFYITIPFTTELLTLDNLSRVKQTN